jgi:hypothetical protein
MRRLFGGDLPALRRPAGADRRSGYWLAERGEERQLATDKQGLTQIKQKTNEADSRGRVRKLSYVLSVFILVHLWLIFFS